ncbi:DUF1707 SHOCT-like domain-containing protein [Nocardia mexicana]|uniref:Uncharacterized protein DUF1707 n=1 Tax=Nocardia mexicana TaxID=279262 RepID=A0A370H572_9NOCA|nr:DUF1707 domain-containing protein [Nocardia mexicana]RDI51523.1 uncharacterized protein DUF1707 [Nocardia mexicana]
MADSPDIRIGTAEREEAMRRLSDHFAAGRLSVAEFDERSGTVAAAVTRGDLVQVFADLPEPVPEQPAPVPEQPAPVPEPSGRGRRPEFRGPVMGLVVILALVLFFTTHTWLWFLLIPAVGAFIGARRRHDHDQHRREIEQHRREIDQHHQELGRHFEMEQHRRELKFQRRELKQQARELRHERRNRRRGH